MNDTINTTTVRPGWIVVLKTYVRGGIEYRRNDLDHERDGATDRSKWETERIITDADEYERAIKVRSQLSRLVRKASLWTPFGLICPTDQAEQLDEALAAARAMVEEYNATARHTTVAFSVLRGRIAESDEEARTAIANELAEMLDELNEAMASGKVSAIRKAAQRIKTTNRILEPESESAKAIERAVKHARGIATKIVQRAADQQPIDDLIKRDKRTVINAARFAVLGSEAAAA